MAFNHYAKMKRILIDYPGWYIVQINEPTISTGFNGEIKKYDHFYRVYDVDGNAIKYCKFQQLDRFAQAMAIPAEALPIVIE